ncbi:hypothetical protein [Marinospirillum perlucidum]|uniref:hypothetical protein n=1 Tax=Marinospirillum perlucidum TaxID=1982602 RepID=UPI000DF46683|nr:hypothetical protein [Marinospirillum perlucidum]
MSESNTIPFTSWVDPQNQDQAQWVIKYLQKKNHPLLHPAHLLAPTQLLIQIKEGKTNSIGEPEFKELRRLMELAWRVHKTRSKKSRKQLVQIEVSKSTRTKLRSEAKQQESTIPEVVSEMISSLKNYKSQIKEELRQEAEKKQRMKDRLAARPKKKEPASGCTDQALGVIAEAKEEIKAIQAELDEGEDMLILEAKKLDSLNNKIKIVQSLLENQKDLTEDKETSTQLNLGDQLGD